MSIGVVEVISTDFVIGWASAHGQHHAHVFAQIAGRTIGFTRADLWREDLVIGDVEIGRAFIVLFDEPVPPGDFDQLQVHVLHSPEMLPRWENLRIDASPALQVFVLGSPRSGTSELARTIAHEFNLAWLGEAHAAPAFAEAAEAMSGAIHSPHDVMKFMAKQSFRRVSIDAMRKVYYFIHGSASFLDKTPGVAMIEAAPFLHECFPSAQFIYMQRNGISNILSRMKKFGGDFQEHCTDWVAAIMAWSRVKEKLPHYIEIDQEVMLNTPESVSEEVCRYLKRPELESAVLQSLKHGSAEHTGAGVGRNLLSSTGWSDEQIQTFAEICGLTMLSSDYPMD